MTPKPVCGALLLILGLSFVSLACSGGARKGSEAPQPPETPQSSETPPPAARPADTPSSELENTSSSKQKEDPSPAACDDPRVETQWMDESGAPSPGWWQKIADIPPKPPSPVYYPGAVGPVVRIGLAGAPHSVTRVYRQNFGHFRVCYEAGLGKEPKLAGHWVVRVAHAGPVCSLEVVDTNLPEAFSGCLAEAVEEHIDVPNATGLIEVVLAFQPR